MFKSQTDWVIGVPEQEEKLNSQNISYHRPFSFRCIHGMQFNQSAKKINGKPAKIFNEIILFFK